MVVGVGAVCGRVGARVWGRVGVWVWVFFEFKPKNYQIRKLKAKS